ncbi:MAG: DoxX family protein [Prevotella sp.]|nr:DoxX family protein [Prevotella sp.]
MSDTSLSPTHTSPLWLRIVGALCRLALTVTFIFSGFVKAVDPLGTQYKIEDYLAAMGLGEVLPGMVTLAMSVALAATEFCLGIFLLFAIRRRLTTRLVLAMMLVMTPLTLWLAIANPVSDCGCFGDAIVLTNWQTFWKNIVLLACAIVVAWRPCDMFRFISRSNQWIVVNYSALFILAVSGWSLYDLPQFDFRPYHIGASLRGEEASADSSDAQFEYVFIYEKNGERREFDIDNLPDSTWTFVDRQELKAGAELPKHDLRIDLLYEDTDSNEGEDITGAVISDTSYTFLLVTPKLEKADDSRLDLINELFEYSLEHGYGFYCLTASDAEGRQQWRDMTGAEYPFCFTDETTLKTVIRSNPGLLLLKDGTVIGKWSHNRLPQITAEEAAQPLEQLAIGTMPEDSVPGKILKLLLWFVLPLTLLTLADRTWMWTRYMKRTRRQDDKATDATQQSTINTQQ